MSEHKITRKKLSFTGALGHQLAARLDLPAKPVAYAIFAHYFTGNKDITSLVRISRILNKANIALFRFDYTGLGESEGNFADSNFTSNVGDLIAAARFLAANYSAPQLLVGHSLGGTAAIMAASQLESIRAVATIGSPADTVHVQNNFLEYLEEIKFKGEAQISLNGRKINIKKQFLEDIAQQDITKAIINLKKPLLIMHSPLDQIVDIEHAQKIYQLAKHPKSFVSLDKADHLLLSSEDSDYVGSIIASWVRRYLL